MQIGRSFKNFWRRFYSLPYYLHEAWEPLTWPGFFGQTLANVGCWGSSMVFVLLTRCLAISWHDQRHGIEAVESCNSTWLYGLGGSTMFLLCIALPIIGLFLVTLRWFAHTQLTSQSVFAFLWRFQQPIGLVYLPIAFLLTVINLDALPKNFIDDWLIVSSLLLQALLLIPLALLITSLKLRQKLSPSSDCGGNTG